MGRGRDRSAAIANEQREANNRGGSKYFYVDTTKLDRLGISQYKTENGPNAIRIISPRFEKYDQLPYFGKKVYIHTKIGADESTFVCLRKMYGEPCPVCEQYEKMKEKNPDDEALKDLAPKLRYLFLVVDIKSKDTEAKGLRWYDAPVVVNDNIAELSQDRRKGIIDPSDPDDGRDIEFTRSGSGLGTKYKGFRFYEADPIPDAWMDDVPEDFEEILKKPSYEEVAQEVNGVAPRSRGSDEEGGSRRRRSRDDAPKDEGRRSRRSRDDEPEETVQEEEDTGRRRRRSAEPEEETSSRRRRGREEEGPSDDVASRVNAIVDEGAEEDD